jgi:hypothetical protein
LDRHAGSAGPLHAAAAQAQSKLVTGLPAFERSRSPGREFGGWQCSRAAQKEKDRPTQNKESKTMNGTVLQAVLWIVAGLFLTLLIIRRGKRKASKT